ncbi:MAG TPA: acyl-CoA dehydrogenase [Solirubrobacteraceae bacterium]|nr:acyl-CoA dehydrogenase [Solirubrobacteraceae bacterium]
MATLDLDPTAGGFDPGELQRILDGRYAELRARIREVMSRPEFTPPLEISREDYRATVMGWAVSLAEEGVTAPGFPEQYGGEGDFGANVAGFETIAFGDLSLLVKFGVQFGLFGGAVQQLGSARHHERYLHDIATLKLPGCFAMSEAGHGSDVQNLLTTATYDRDTQEFVVDTPVDAAHKDYIGNAARDGRMAVVFAQLHVGTRSHGVHALLVPIRDEAGNVMEGVRIEDDGPKLGLNGVDNGKLWFDHVRVPRENLLDRWGTVSVDGVYSSPIDNPTKRFFSMVGALVQGRICVGGASVSASELALTIAVRHGLRRRQFGPEPGQEVPILDYRVHQRRLLPRLAKSYALHFAQGELRDRFHHVMSDEGVSDQERRELESLAAGMKATASWHATDTIQACREACGGAGYMAENRFAALKADTDIFTTFEGDNVVLMLLLARGLLTGYAEQFTGLSPVGMASFVAGQAAEVVVERLFARQIAQVVGDWVGSKGEDEDLLDPAIQLALFRWREGHITTSAAQRFRRHIKDGHAPFEVFRSIEDHIVDVGRAHMATILLEAFQRAVRECPQGPTRVALKQMCDLFALTEIEREKGFYQEHGRLSGPRCKAVSRQVGELCDRVRAQAGAYVDAFGIPDAVLRAPIALAGESL